MAEAVGTYLRLAWAGLVLVLVLDEEILLHSSSINFQLSSAQLSPLLSVVRSLVRFNFCRSFSHWLQLLCTCTCSRHLLIPALNCPSNASTAAASRPAAAPPTTPAIHCSPRLCDNGAGLAFARRQFCEF